MKKLSDMSSLHQRIISAVVLAPLVLGIIYVGGLAWTILVIVACVIMLNEWFKMTKSSPSKGVWRLAGLLYIIPPCLVLLTIRGGIISPSMHNVTEELERTIVFMLIFMIWAVDIGAYIFGKTIGGPKIAPKISPNKTWAGLLGGTIGAILICLIYFKLVKRVETLSSDLLLASLIVGCIFAIVAQMGDFFESWIKRKFNVKDSGDIIPGHGGLLDRLDGLLAVCWLPIIALIVKLLIL